MAATKPARHFGVAGVIADPLPDTRNTLLVVHSYRAMVTELATRSDKTACSRWQANQFRLLLHMGAYWLLRGRCRQSPPPSTRNACKSLPPASAVKPDDHARPSHIAFMSSDYRE